MNVERDALVKAFCPNARGFAHVIFEGPVDPVDWGISEVRRSKRRVDTYVHRLSVLTDRYHPDVLVLRGRGEAGNAQFHGKIEPGFVGPVHEVAEQV